MRHEREKKIILFYILYNNMYFIETHCNLTFSLTFLVGWYVLSVLVTLCCSEEEEEDCIKR